MNSVPKIITKLDNSTNVPPQIFKEISKTLISNWMSPKRTNLFKQSATKDETRPSSMMESTGSSNMWNSSYPGQLGSGTMINQRRFSDYDTKVDKVNFPFSILLNNADNNFNESLMMTDTSLPQLFSTSSYDVNRTGGPLNDSVITMNQPTTGMSGTDILRWVHIPAYAVILCLAVAGNALVIGTLAPRLLPRIPSRLSWKTPRSLDGPSGGGSGGNGGSWRVRSLTNVFLLNLAVADLLLGLLCVPFTLVGAILRDFVFGGAMCKLIPYLQAVSVSVSAWTLVAISVERYFAICHPLRSRRWQTLSHAYKLITLIWFGSLTAMAPVAALSELQPTSQGHHKCREKWPSLDFERAYNVLLDVVLLVLPLAILTATYSLITRTLRRGMRLERAQRKKQRKSSRKGSSSTRRSRRWRGRPRGEATAAGGETSDVGRSAVLEGSNSRNLDSIGGTSGVSEVYLERNGSTATRCCRKRPEDPEPRDRWHLRRVRYGGAASAEDDETDESEPEDDDEGGGELRRSDAERSLRSKRRVIRMLFVLVLEFFVCWTPLHALNTAASFFGAHAVYSGIGGYPAVAACHLLAYCSSCCNPITYGFMNARFRQAFLGAFGCQRKKQKTDLERLKTSRSIKVNSSGKIEARAPAFALAYTGGDSVTLRGGVEECNDSLSEFLPPLLESKCIDEPREGLKSVLVESNR